MSQENVEVVRRISETFEAGVERGDFGAAWTTGALAEDCELIPAPENPEPRRYQGREGFTEFMLNWTEDFEGYSIHRERLIDAGEDRVVGFFTQSATGKGSGAPVEQEYAVVYELENGQLVRLRIYLDRDQARQAVGLWD
jgi:ketosteroid isomerase-like protein